MSSQPANTAIKIYQRVRGQRDDYLHTSVKHRAAGVAWNTLNIVPPGEEILVYEKRDATTAVPGWRYGLPVTIMPRAKATFATVVENLSGVAFPVAFPLYPRDKFVEKDAAHVADDIMGDVDALSPAPHGLYEAV